MLTKQKQARTPWGLTKTERSWIMYDWANSAFSTIIAATIFPLFLDAVGLQNNISTNDSTAYLGYATSIGFLICALLAPILGALGDFPGYKKRMFTLFMLLGVVGTALLAFTGNVMLLLIFYVLTNIGFSGSVLYYDSFLTDITTPERMDLVSSLGYGIGYITGSTIPLIVALALYQFHDAIGISQDAAMRIAFLMTALWWGLFTIPMLRNVQQTHSVPRKGGVVRQSLQNIVTTFREITKDKGLLWYIIAYFFYIDGVGTIIHMAVKFGKAKGLQSIHLLLILLAVQLVAFPCAILYGVLAKKFGARRMILVGIATYLLVCVVGLFMNTILHFVLLGALVGTAQGGIQALSRSYFGKLVPKENSSEYFGFFDVFGKFSAVLGPALFGLFGQMTGHVQAGVIPLVLLFLVGGLIFVLLVPKEQTSQQ